MVEARRKKSATIEPARSPNEPTRRPSRLPPVEGYVLSDGREEGREDEPAQKSEKKSSVRKMTVR